MTKGDRGARTARATRRVLALAAASLAVSLAAQAAPAAAVGFQDFSYSAAGVSAPTRDKPQSKLWFNDGAWWGSLYNRSAGRYEIHRLNRATETWSTTGVALDNRPSSHADTLWDGTHLYVASISDTDVGRLYRYSYDTSTDTYSLDLGFPVTLTSGGAETITIAKDSTGRIWASFVSAQDVYVTHSTSSDATFTTPFVIPVAAASGIDPDDLSAIVAYPGRIGVMWGNQIDGRTHFASHADGAPDGDWTHNPVNSGPRNSDDHISVTSLNGDPAGKVFAVFKTSRTAASDPLIVAAVLGNDDVWRTYTVATAAHQHTRPVIAVDPEHRKMHVFSSAPCCSGGVIYEHTSDLDNPSFTDGLGTPFIDLPTDPKANNPSTTKQPLTSETGIVVVAGDDSTKRYLHGSRDLAPVDNTPPETTITSAPPQSSASTTATFHFSSSEGGSTFECRLDGGAFAACESPRTYSSLAAGAHTFEVRAIDQAGNVDATPAAHTWSIDPTAPSVFAPEADSYVEEALPNTNRGAATSLRVDGGAGTHQDTYLRFDVPSLPAGVLSAKLRVYLTNGSGNGPAVYGAPNGWSETAINWANRPARSTPALDDRGAVAANSIVEWDVSDHVRGPGTYTLVLGTESTDGVVLNSREAVSNVPQLVITTGNDTTPPDTTLTQTPPASTQDSSATFAFSSSEPDSRFDCRVDDEPFARCTSPHSVFGLAQGPHSFEVRAVDLAGNADPTPARHTWTVEPPAPPPPVESQFTAIADTYVDQDHDDDNYGTANELKAKLESGKTRISYLRFRTSGLSGNIESARVRLWVTNDTVDGPGIFRTGLGWTERGLTWENQLAPTSGKLDDKAFVKKDAFVEYDVSGQIAGNGDYAFVLVPAHKDEIKFSSRETSSSSRRPRLIVTTRATQIASARSRNRSRSRRPARRCKQRARLGGRRAARSPRNCRFTAKPRGTRPLRGGRGSRGR